MFGYIGVPAAQVVTSNAISTPAITVGVVTTIRCTVL
jgi:hypothetical protein